MAYFLFDLDRTEAELVLAVQLSGSRDDEIGVAFMNATLKLFRGDCHGAVHILKALPATDASGALYSSVAQGGLLLALSVAEERDDIVRTLRSTAVARDAWLDRVRRGEHWTLVYEVGRIVALGYLGEIHQARRDLVVAASLLSAERLNGIDGDVLIAAAMLCLYDNDQERASVLLGAVNTTRTHATLCLYMEAFERVHGRPEGDLATARMTAIHQRLDGWDPVRARRARAMLDDEIAHLTANN